MKSIEAKMSEWNITYGKVVKLTTDDEEYDFNLADDISQLIWIKPEYEDSHC